MALFPLQGMFDGDFVLMLVPVDDQDTMTQVAEKVAYHVVGHRVAAQDRPLQVRHNSVAVAPDATVTGAGFGPMDVVEVGYL
ncbi:toluene-4-monooxygenase system B family protein [Rhodococcus sp. IITD102]|uniref:toluene-4-monooxygenase system B family protein n=1 Tax=Rhodococcus TaxID=1827 RepID=UPI0009340EB4|nr:MULTISPECIES: toluene-4-monooxygenase system B family protein [Rhodococcus]WKK14672.1 toluene-4-monooxygenase system B family protein [Rhodococcus ruber]